MGITPETIEQYTKFMANKRLKEIGMQPLFEGFDSNPYKQLENIADTNGAGSVKGNFFEANVSSYKITRVRRLRVGRKSDCTKKTCSVCKALLSFP